MTEASSFRTRRDHFDALFAGDPDPWNYACDASELKKRDAVLHALGPGRVSHALELGCANGVQTQALARRVTRLDAVDGSDAALDRARARLSAPNATLHRAALPATPPRPGFRAVIASEILYYLTANEIADQLRLLRRSAAPGARLIAVQTVRRHRDFACDPKTVRAVLLRILGPATACRTGRGWRLFVHRLHT
ncbi:MAG: class I SAM-dependent DNA methyltransferase [Oceanicaulis sp.]